MKKFLTILIALIMVVSFTACSSSPTDTDSSDNGQNDEAVSSNQNDSNADVEGDIDKESDSDGPNYEEEGLPIPNGYPVDLVALMDGYKIVAGAKENKGDQQEVWVKFMVDTEIGEVSAYYEDILSQGEIENAKNMGDDLYMIDAKLEGKDINVTVTTEDLYENFKSSVLITIKGDLGESADSGSGEVDLSTANKNIKDVDKLPSEYPSDLIPLYGGSMVTHGEKSQYGDKEIILIQLYSKDSSEELRDFYTEVLKDAEDKQEGTISTGSYSLGGVMDKYKASLLIGNLDLEGYEYETFCTIQLDIIK